jgi:hypothetical protein
VVEVFLLVELLELIVKYLSLGCIAFDWQVVVVFFSDKIFKLL